MVTGDYTLYMFRMRRAINIISLCLPVLLCEDEGTFKTEYITLFKNEKITGISISILKKDNDL